MGRRMGMMGREMPNRLSNSRLTRTFAFVSPLLSGFETEIQVWTTRETVPTRQVLHPTDLENLQCRSQEKTHREQGTLELNYNNPDWRHFDHNPLYNNTLKMMNSGMAYTMTTTSATKTVTMRRRISTKTS